MNFLQMQEAVSYTLDDLSFGYFTTTQVKRWLNNAQFEAQKIIVQSDEGSFVKCVQTTCIVGQDEYVLPEDMLKINRVQIIQSPDTANELSSQIFPVVLSQIAKFTRTNAYPSVYYLRRNRLVLVSPPDNTYTLRIDYTYRLAELVNDSDTSEIETQYHEYLTILAAIDGFLKDDRAATQLIAKKQWYEKLFEEDAEDRKVDTPRHVIMMDDDIGGGGLY